MRTPGKLERIFTVQCELCTQGLMLAKRTQAAATSRLREKGWSTSRGAWRCPACTNPRVPTG